MRELFVYWRAPVEHGPAVRLAIEAWQTALSACHPGLVAALYRRSDGAAPLETWMETYARPPAGIDGALAQALGAGPGGGLDRLIDGARHVEAFDRVEPGAHAGP